MAESKLWYMVAYDVREPRRLRKVEKHLKGYGERVQYSIFRCRLSERQLERLRWELARIMEREDALLIIGLCRRCASHIRTRNTPEAWPKDPASFEIV